MAGNERASQNTGGQQKRAVTLEKTKNWYADRYQVVVVQRNVLALITFLALAGLGGSVMAVATLNASKTFEPYVIEVEEKTGITTQLTRNSVEKYRADDAVIRYFLVKYVQAREGYNVHDYQFFYSQVVRVMSSGRIYRSFRKEIDVGNPSSAVNLGRKAARIVEIKSVTPIAEDKYQVRFVRYQREGSDGGGALEEERHLVSTINFDFLDLDLGVQERYINPIGFQVVNYRVDEDRAI